MSLPAGDPYWYYKVLGLHCDGTNGSTTFTDVKGKTVTANGNAQISTAQYPALTGKTSSALFDGAGDYLTIANSTDFTFTADFTIQLFVRFVGGLGVLQLLYEDEAPSAAYYGILFEKTATDKFAFVFMPDNAANKGDYGSNITLTGTTTVALNTWYRVQVRRIGTTVALAVNGTQEASATLALGVGIYNYGGTKWIAGRNTSAYYANAYLSEFEIYKGVGKSFDNPSVPFPDTYVRVSGTTKDASGNLVSRLVRVYRRDTGALVDKVVSHPTTGEFVVTAANTSPTVTKHFAIAHDASTGIYNEWRVLGLHCDGANASTTFTDVHGKTVTANGNAQISTAQYPALTGKTSSALFDGTGDYLTIADSADFAFGAGNFTIKCRFKQTATGGTYALLAQRTTTTSSYSFAFQITGSTLTFICSTSGTATTHTATVAYTQDTTTWHEATVARYGGNITVYLDGSGGTPVSIGSSSLADSAAVLSIGGDTTGSSNQYAGYLSEVEIYKGVALHTANFTPSSVPFADALDAATENALIYDDITPY